MKPLRINRIYFVISLSLICFFQAHAQVNEYFFTQQSQSYSEISGGTVLWSGTFDEQISGEITIPSFTFNAIPYTSIFVSVNGFITFGTAPSAISNPISNAGNYPGAVSAFGRDLIQAESGTPAIRYEQVGSEFVVQWKDVRRKTITGEIISFQVRLNTSNNRIVVVYGGTITPGSNTTYPQVGLRGATNTDFNNRTITSVGGNWINSAAGGSSSATMYFNSATPATVPSVGLTFTWKPLLNPDNFAAQGQNTSQIDLSWQKNFMNDNVLVAFNTTSTIGAPNNGTAYSAGNAVPGGGTFIYNGSASSFSHTGLATASPYYYKAWSVDASNDYSPGTTINTRTAATLPYLQEFNTTSLPTDWITNMLSTSSHGLAATRSLSRAISSSGTTYFALSPLLGAITANTYMSFYYRIIDNSGWPATATLLGPDNWIDVQVSTDDGATFTTIHTLNQNNHIPSTAFANISLSLGAYSGDFIRVRFLITWGSGDYYVDFDNVSFEEGNNMSYSASTVEQASTESVGQGSSSNEVVRLIAWMQKSGSPVSMTSITFNTTGSTNATNDIAAAKIYYTTSPVFSTATQFGSTVSNPSGTHTVTGSQALSPGTNFFWLAYDIRSTATINNLVDGQCTQFVTSESGTPKTPTATTATGTRKIVAEISGIKTIPGDYASIAAAVTALNASVLGTGGVTFHVAGGYTENITAPIIITTTGSSGKPILFRKNGAGARPLVTHTGTGTLTASSLGYNGDAVVVIEGADYVTFDSIDVAAGNSGIEYGYYLRKATATNGCSNVTIKNANVSMTKGTSDRVVGICVANNTSSSSNISVTTPAGRHENITITGNTIDNVFTGIFLGGSSAFPDQGFIVGSSGAGNIIQDFSGNSTTVAYGIYLINNTNSLIRYNTINNLNGGGTAFTGSANGIYNASNNDASFTAENNTITLTTGSTQLNGIYTTSSGALQINQNTISLNTSSASGATFAFIYNSQGSSNSSANTDIRANVFSSSTLQTTSTVYLIYNSSSRVAPEVTTIQDNMTSGTISRTGASGTFYVYFNNSPATGTLNITGNSFSSISLVGGSTFYGIYNITAAENDVTLSGNSISGITGGTGQVIVFNIQNCDDLDLYDNQVYDISGGSSVMSLISTTSVLNPVIHDNSIHDISSGGVINGILLGTGSNPAHIYGNEIYDLSTISNLTTQGLVNGITVSTGTEVYIYNNFISGLDAPSCQVNTDAIRGVSITSTLVNSTVGVYYNTIYLDAAFAAGTSIGSSGIYAASSTVATTATLDLRNNIIVNKSSQAGSGFAAALRRNGASLANYSLSSDNNIFYTGTPGPNRVIYTNNASGGTFPSIDLFKAHVGPTRDSLSWTEDPPFVNKVTPPYNLRLQNGQPSYCESGGAPVTAPISVSQDFDGASRPATPDAGADEFSGISLYVENPLAFEASYLNSQQVNLTFTPNTSSNTVVIIYNTSGNFTMPTGSPTVGQALAGGTVVSAGTASPAVHSGLTPGQAVYYRAFCYNGTSYSWGLDDNTTPSVLPPSAITASAVTQNQVSLQWNLNERNHDVIVAAHTAFMNGNPVNGTLYNTGDPIPNGGTVIYRGPAASYNHTGLSSWSQWFYKMWSVDLYNYHSTGIFTDTVTASEPIAVLPYSMNFDGTWAHSPSEPQGWNVVDVSGGFTWEKNTVFSQSAPASARGHEDGAASDYLISPPIVLPDTTCQLSWFDYVSSASSPNSYKVLVSTSGKSISSFTYELADITCTNTVWQPHVLNLDAFMGQTIYIAFHHYYSQSQYQTFLIDDVKVETLIPPVSTLEAPLNAIRTFTNPSLRWNMPSTFIPVTGYRVYLDTSPTPTTLVYDGPHDYFQPSSLNHNTVYYWKVVPYNSNGEAYNVPVWSFSTVTATQLAESFEQEYFPPVSWAMDYGWLNESTSYYHGTMTARRYTSTASVKLITPLLAIESGDKLAFFHGTASSTYQRIQIYYSLDKTTWTAFGSLLPVTVGGWGYHEADLTSLAGNSCYLAIGLNYLSGGSPAYVYVDHVTGPDIVPILPMAPDNPDPVNNDEYISHNALLQWDPGLSGGIPSGYRVYLGTSANPTSLVYNGLNEFYQSPALSYNTVYYWKVVPYNSVGDAASCPVWSFTTVPEGGVQIGRDSVDYLDLPIYPEYGYSYSQTIYLQSEIDIPGKRIEKIWYYWSGADTGIFFRDWVIYMGHTTKNVFSNAGDWIPVAQMTEVFDGPVIIPASHGWVEITLDIPFTYNNSDHLVIAVDENTPGFTNEWGTIFFGTDSDQTRGIQAYSDNTNPDPASPPEADGIVFGFANIRLSMEDVPVAPVFYAIPASKDFGLVVTGEASETQEFVIRNRGVGVLTITGTSVTGANAGDFELTDNNTYPVNLAANQGMNVSVVFEPAGAGARSASLQVTSTLGGVTHHAIPLSGTGFEAYVSTFPYLETFETGSPMRLGWIQDQVTGTMSWSYGEGAGGGTLNSAHTGSLNARYVDMGSNAVTMLVSPVLNLSGVTNPELTFWYAQEAWSGDQNELKVYYRTASNQPWVEIYYDAGNVDVWKFYYLSLPSPTSTYQIAFEGYDYYGYANVIDDVTIQSAPGPRTMWTGAISSDWNDPANWTNGLPGSGHAVVIGAGLNSPVIATPVTVLQITLSTAVDITLTGAGSLTVLGP